MIKIKQNEDLKEQFKKHNLIYPILKSNGFYGLKGSSLLDDKDLRKCELKVLTYLLDKGIVEIDIKNGGF